MANKHANKKPKKKGKVIKMANDKPNQEQEQKKLSPEEAMTKLVEQFKTSDSETRENILFNMTMRMGTALDGVNARLDMLGGIVYKLDGVQEIMAKMNEERQKAMEAQQQKEGSPDGKPESKPEPEPDATPSP